MALHAPERYSAKVSLSGALVCLDQRWSSGFFHVAQSYTIPLQKPSPFGIAIGGRCLIMASAPPADAAPASAPAVAVY
jgi:hypothetical protein